MAPPICGSDPPSEPPLPPEAPLLPALVPSDLVRPVARHSRSETASDGPHDARRDVFFALPRGRIELALDGPGVVPGAGGAHDGDSALVIVVDHPAQRHEPGVQVRAFSLGSALRAGDHVTEP